MENTPPAKTASLAVLPFENLSANDKYDYFCSGIVAELIVDLSHFHGLKIISFYTSSQLLSLRDDLEAARKISIQYLLKGFLRFHQDTLRIHAQLVDTATGRIVWTDRYEGTAEEIFEIQDSVVEKVVYAISSEVELSLLAASRPKSITSLAAYDCYLRGMERLRLGTLEADQQAREFFNQALEIAPDYSRAYAGLSLTYFNEWSCQLWELYESSEQNAYNYAVKAYQLDDTDHSIHMILGRIYIYRRQFDAAEQHIERSFELNKNDADNLIQLASCFAFIGRAAKGEELFLKALSLNPYRNLWYYQYGSFTYFVQRKFEISIEMALKRQLTNVWVDLPGYIAAACAHIGDMDMARKYIRTFIDSYTQSITKGLKPSSEEMLEWVQRANPFKHQEDADCIVDGLVLAGLQECLADRQVAGLTQGPAKPDNISSIFIKEQEIWRMEFEHFEITMVDIKGYHDISKLLGQPDTDIHCSELMGTISSMDENDFIVDDRARRAYEQHLTDLREDIAEAEEHNDLGRKGKLQIELQQLLEQLSKDLGIGKRSRKMKSPAERARAAVTLRIRNAIKKITEKHPALGKHLSNSIRTGIFCRYSPEHSREWNLD